MVTVDELLDERRRSPRDNLLSALIAAEEAGELLTDAELQSMVVPFDVSCPCPARAGSVVFRHLFAVPRVRIRLLRCPRQDSNLRRTV